MCINQTVKHRFKMYALYVFSLVVRKALIYYEEGKEKQMVKGSSWGHLQRIAWGSGGHLPAFSL